MITFPSFITALAPSTRAVLVVAVLVAVVFVGSKFFGSKTSKGERTTTKGTTTSSQQYDDLHLAITNIIRRAAQSAEKAGQSKNPIQQIVHIREGLTMLESARTIEPDDAQLSLISRINVGKLDNYLQKAEEICVQKLRQTTPAPSPPTASTHQQ